MPLTENAAEALVFGWISIAILILGAAVIVMAVYVAVRQGSIGLSVVATLVLGVAMELHPILAGISYAEGRIDIQFREAARDIVEITGGIHTQVAALTDNVARINDQVADLAEQQLALIAELDNTVSFTGGAGTTAASLSLDSIVTESKSISTAVASSRDRLKDIEVRQQIFEELVGDRPGKLRP